MRELWSDKNLMLLARGVSKLFSPFFMPTLGVALLFLFSYLRIMPLSYKFLIVVTVFTFTIMMPTCCIHFYRTFNGWSLRELSTREKRLVPYILSIASYGFCLVLLYNFRVPGYMSGIVIAALLLMILSTIINIWWKISNHMTMVGGVVGALACYGELFAWNPIWWICLTLFMGGIVGTSRLVLRQHTLTQVLLSFPLGFVCAVIGILFGQFIIDYVYYMIMLR